MTNLVSAGLQRCGKRAKALRRPQKRGLWITHCAGFNKIFQGIKQRLVFFFERFSPGALASNTTFSQRKFAGQFLYAGNNDTTGNSCNFVNKLKATPAMGLGLRGGPKSSPFLVKMRPYGFMSDTHSFGFFHVQYNARNGKKSLFYF
jgi:hypothetical protein